ncbi:MAG: HAD-IC family P-type ATPase, partial [Clostridiales bacterium]
ALTGESVPSEKDAQFKSDDELPLGDRVNMAFSSSLVTYGRGKGVVCSTGMNTEVGKIATMIQQSDNTETPLKHRLEHLGKVLGVVTLIICAVIFVVGLLYGRAPFEIFLVAVSLAVAAIPEGLPAIATIVLAIGVQRMVKRNAIIRTLPSVETLGSATVICSDKTGTLTQNVMTVEQAFINGKLSSIDDLSAQDDDYKLLLQGILLCNDSSHNVQGDFLGDPTEIALLVLSEKAGILKGEQEKATPRVMEVPFDSERKMMTTAHQAANGFRVYTKGGVDEVLRHCNKYLLNGKIVDLDDRAKATIAEANSTMAANALRVLALSYRDMSQLPGKGQEGTLEDQLIFVGLTGMIDPPRMEAAAAVEVCRRAGIKPVMITGDHKITAMAIGRKLGIIKDESEAISGAELDQLSDEQLADKITGYAVYARVSPEHKVRI